MPPYPLPNIPASEFNWSSEEEKIAEFKAAASVLANSPAGTTLSDLTKPYGSVMLTHRFFTDGKGNIFAKMASPISIKTQNARLRVTHAETYDGQRFILKEEVLNSSSQIVPREAEIAIDTDSAISGYNDVNRNETMGAIGNIVKITLYRYLGITLTEYLSKNPTLNVTERLNLAIQVALVVAKLHTGQLSLSDKKYAHRDLKPENITIDEHGKIHLIDFGYSQILTKEPANLRGTPLYLCMPTVYDDDDDNYYYVITDTEYADIFALLRIIYCPPTVQYFATSMEEKTFNRKDNHSHILDDSIIEAHPALKSLYEAEKVAENTGPGKTLHSATELAVKLISVRYTIKEETLQRFFTLSELSALVNASELLLKHDPTYDQFLTKFADDELRYFSACCDMLEEYDLLQPKFVAMLVADPQKLFSHQTKIAALLVATLDKKEREEALSICLSTTTMEAIPDCADALPEDQALTRSVALIEEKRGTTPELHSLYEPSKSDDDVNALELTLAAHAKLLFKKDFATYYDLINALVLTGLEKALVITPPSLTTDIAAIKAKWESQYQTTPIEALKEVKRAIQATCCRQKSTGPQLFQAPNLVYDTIRPYLEKVKKYAFIPTKEWESLCEPASSTKENPASQLTP